MLIRTVEAFLTRHAMSATQFGREAAQDPRLVADMREGREPRPPLDQRVRGFMAGFEQARADPPPRRRAQAQPRRNPRPETPDAV